MFSDLFAGNVSGRLGHHVGVGNLGLAPRVLLQHVRLLHLALHTHINVVVADPDRLNPVPILYSIRIFSTIQDPTWELVKVVFKAKNLYFLYFLMSDKFFIFFRKKVSRQKRSE